MRYHSTGRDNWTNPTQRRHTDFGHGHIESMDDDDLWGRGMLWGAPIAAVVWAVVWWVV